MNLAAWLYSHVSPETYLELLARFGRQHHYIPAASGCPCLRAERDAQVREEWGMGVPVAELARRHQITTRQVQRILRQPRRNATENDTTGADMSRALTDFDGAAGPAARRPHVENP